MLSQIKSKERVRDVAEVFTAKKQVNDMLDLVKDYSENIEGTFLEPACGNGNFLVIILERKLNRVLELSKNPRNKSQDSIEFMLIKTISSIYGVDIMQDNIEEAHERLKVTIKNFFYENYNTRKVNFGFWDSIDWVLKKNIVMGNTMTDPDKVIFLDYGSPKKLYFKIKEFYLQKPKNHDNLFEESKQLNKYKLTHYLDLPKLI
jgi:hypothetical protein